MIACSPLTDPRTSSPHQLAILEERLEAMKRKMGKMWALLVVPIVLLLPPFLTHVVPAMVMYCWILIPLAVFFTKCYVLVGSQIIAAHRWSEL